MQSRSITVRTALLCSTLFCVSSPWAQTSPYYVGINQSFSSDSNLYRFAEGLPQTRDVISSTGLVAGVDQLFGRQHMTASANVRANRYRDTSRLNNTSHGISAGLDWSTVDEVSGNVSYSNSQNLARFGDDFVAQFTDKNVENNEQLGATIRKGVGRRFTAEASIEHRSVNYSSDVYNNLDYRQDAMSVGLRHEVSGFLNVGVGLRHTRGKYPQFGATATTPAIGDGVKRNDIDLSANWQPSGRSSVNARVSYGKLTREQATSGGFSGATGVVTWAYAPTAKLNFNTSFSRDTGTDSNSYSVNTFGGTTATVSNNFSRLTNALQATANYGATAKLSFNAALNYSERTLVDSVTIGNVASPREGTDATTNVSVGARFNPTRGSTLSCGVGRESRSTQSVLSYAYSANTANCSAQLVLQ